MAIRAIRGATSVSENSAEEILSRTRAMVQTALQANRVAPEDIVSIVFVVTPDLDAVFPARAAREMGLAGVPLLDMVSPDVKGAMPRLVRMLLTWNTDRDQGSVTHVYLGEAEALRPDLVERSRANLGAAQKGGEPHW